MYIVKITSLPHSEYPFCHLSIVFIILEHYNKKLMLKFFFLQLNSFKSKRPSLNSLNTLLKRFSYGRLAKSVSARERLCGCRQGSSYPRLITDHAPSNSVVPYCPCLRPAPILPCGKFLEARPPSKLSTGGAPRR